MKKCAAATPCGKHSDLLLIAQARANRFYTDWQNYLPPKPRKLGVCVFRDYPLIQLVRYIDWSPFFQAWELVGSYPKILDDPVVGQEAKRLLADAEKMLEQVAAERWLTAHAVLGLFPALSRGDDGVVKTHSHELVFHYLRQQQQKPKGQPNYCLADFIAPEENSVCDFIGAKALADRLAEAFAEHLHERVRREFWGYAPHEDLSNEALIAENYRGIRPAPGYPACPDHTEKRALFDLLGVEQNTGIPLTESLAMYPAASVSGWYFSHPKASYFNVGKLGRDQVQDLSPPQRLGSCRGRKMAGAIRLD